MKKALLVDDDAAMNFVNKVQLHKTGAFSDINVAHNGKQALEIITNATDKLQQHPDVIFLDLNMPVMGGFAFLEAFHRLSFNNKERIRIVILSSSDSQEEKDKALEFGIKDYYTKPISLESVFKFLGSCSTIEL
jgi:CheY-like chemotaxis protein